MDAQLRFSVITLLFHLFSSDLIPVDYYEKNTHYRAWLKLFAFLFLSLIFVFIFGHSGISPKNYIS